jgi:hypothetical protein
MTLGDPARASLRGPMVYGSPDNATATRTIGVPTSEAPDPARDTYAARPIYVGAVRSRRSKVFIVRVCQMALRTAVPKRLPKALMNKIQCWPGFIYYNIL